MNKARKIVLGVTGSIAAYKSADIVRRLKDVGCSVKVVMTESAQRFITPLTLSSLSGNEVYIDALEKQGHMAHIELAQETDIVLIAPATANIIAKMAHGLADDILSAFLLATRAPVLVAPAMNDDMYGHPATQANCVILKERGVRFIDPVKGKLACGVVGVGHIADVEDIVEAVLKL